VTESGFDHELERTRQRVDALLEQIVPGGREAGELAEAMRHIVFSGGKRLRPALVLLGCEHVGGPAQDALGAALAVELIHAYSLLHDDLPCMDDGQLRRGKPCAHRVWGEATALLAGDALLTLAFEALARHTPGHRPLGPMVVALAEAAGWAGMVGGQVADLQAEGQAPQLERVQAIHAGKTAAMIAASFRLGALAGGGSPEAVARLAEAGHDFGLAFQIVDDLLDLQGSTAQLGKQAGSDQERSKMTWPAVVGVEASRRDAARLVQSAVARCGAGPAAGRIEALGCYLLPRRS
jgi:geranylgeranyl diphosphate synthase, type II